VKCIEDEIPFEVPEGWAWCRLKHVCTMAAGKAKPTDQIMTEPFEGCYPCFGGNGIRGYVDEYNQDGIFSIVGRQGALCGNINIAKGKFYATEHAVVTTLFSGIDFNWSNYVLEALQLNSYATGAAQPGLSVANVLNVFVPVPPTQEQVHIGIRIAEFIKIIENIEDEKENLQTLISSAKSKILDLAIRGKLVPQNPNDEPASVLLERIRAEKEELIKAGKIKRDKKESIIFRGEDNSYYEKVGSTIKNIDDSIPFEIPKNWCFIRLKELWELISGRDLSPSEYNDNQDGIPYITGASNFRNGKIELVRWTPSPQVITQKGDLLLTCKGTIGEMAFNSFGEAHIARQIMAIRNIYGLNSEYLSLCIRFYIGEIKAFAKGLIPGISREDILNLILPIPPENYQSLVVSQIRKSNHALYLIEKSLS
jgi:type I restriction enzyme S subunit